MLHKSYIKTRDVEAKGFFLNDDINLMGRVSQKTHWNNVQLSTM